MKKAALVVLLMVCFSGLRAQVVTQVGVKAGGLSGWVLNSNIIAGNTDTTIFFTPGYTAGLNFGLFFNKRTYYSHKLNGLNFEVCYTSLSQGYKSKTANPLDYRYKLNLGYVDWGLFFQSMPSSDNGFYFMGGPQISMLINAKAKGWADNQITRTDIDSDLMSKIRGSNFQLVMEAGQYFNSRKNNQIGYHIGLRASYGFTDLTKSQKDIIKPYFRNNTAYIGLVLGIDIKTRNYYN